MEYYTEESNITENMPEQLVLPSHVPPNNLPNQRTMIYVNSTLDINCKKAALEILDLLDEMGFSTDRPVDPIELEKKIVSIIKKNISGSTSWLFK